MIKETKKQLLLNQCAENYAVADREFRRYRETAKYDDEWNRLQSICETFKWKLLSAAKAFAPRLSSPAPIEPVNADALEGARKE